MEALALVIILAWLVFAIIGPRIVAWLEELDRSVTVERDRYNELVSLGGSDLYAQSVKPCTEHTDCRGVLRSGRVVLHLRGTYDLDDDAERRARRRAFRAGSEYRPR